VGLVSLSTLNERVKGKSIPLKVYGAQKMLLKIKTPRYRDIGT
jgi:hypothetical protein